MFSISKSLCFLGLFLGSFSFIAPRSLILDEIGMKSIVAKIEIIRSFFFSSSSIDVLQDCLSDAEIQNILDQYLIRDYFSYLVFKKNKKTNDFREEGEGVWKSLFCEITNLTDLQIIDAFDEKNQGLHLFIRKAFEAETACQQRINTILDKSLESFKAFYSNYHCSTK